MTTTTAPGADLATDELKDLLTAATNASFDCGAHDCDDDDNPDVVPYEELARIAHEKREAVLDLFRTTFAAVPASEPVGTVYYERVNDEFHANLDYDRVKDGDQLFLAAPAPVSGMPDPARLTDTKILEIAAQYEHGWADGSGIAPYSPDEDEGQLFVKLIRAVLADVERLLNPTGATK